MLNHINSSYKDLLVLKYFMDLSYKEISKLLDISEGNIKTYLYRAWYWIDDLNNEEKKEKKEQEEIMTNENGTKETYISS